MKLNPLFILLATSVSIVHASVYSGIKGNVLSFIQKSLPKRAAKNNLEYFEEQTKDDVKRARERAAIMQRTKRGKESGGLKTNHVFNAHTGKQRYRIDPVLNFLARRSGKKSKNWHDSEDNLTSSSSSREMQDWKDEWKEHWVQKKFEAINSTAVYGDSVNMLAARPWGVPCGDPNQHDMPWGTCMLPIECEAEYRIYRGDSFCGRTQFVCCALQETNYDMYQGFDLSFENSDIKTDSDEVRNRNLGSRERGQRKRARQKRRRRRQRLKRKRVIKRHIKKIIKLIRKILSKSHRNSTSAKKKKTKQLKEFVNYLKKQYKRQRKAIKNIHELELTNIDKQLQQKIDQIRIMNEGFIRNSTYRDIIVNGTVNPKAVRMLLNAYPELAAKLDPTRRSNNPKPDYLDYDIEYGLLYY